MNCEYYERIVYKCGANLVDNLSKFVMVFIFGCLKNVNTFGAFILFDGGG